MSGLRKALIRDLVEHGMFFLNLPVTDLEKSRNFYAGLGFVENKIISDVIGQRGFREFSGRVSRGGRWTTHL